MGADIFILVIVAILVSGAVCLFTLCAIMAMESRSESRRMKNAVMIQRHRQPEKENIKAA